MIGETRNAYIFVVNALKTQEVTVRYFRIFGRLDMRMHTSG
jgi:hypothetical protein